ncbi:MAG: hypothetical protein GDA52_00975 [Rhodobacteraceae bacterium]|nr:hypothetical protein [Paracoccaceae bacterium]
MKKTILLTVTVMMAAPMGHANAIERACNQSDQRAATPQLCGCIGTAAQVTLNRSDQRQVAGFFRNPQRAQDMRMSDRPRDEALWDRYRAFGNAAKAMCG